MCLLQVRGPSSWFWIWSNQSDVGPPKDLFAPEEPASVPLCLAVLGLTKCFLFALDVDIFKVNWWLRGTLTHIEEDCIICNAKTHAEIWEEKIENYVAICGNKAAHIFIWTFHCVMDDNQNSLKYYIKNKLQVWMNAGTKRRLIIS